MIESRLDLLGDLVDPADWHSCGTPWSCRPPRSRHQLGWILAIVFLVVTVRVILFPVFVKQIKSQRAMQALQPKIKELQEKHKGDRETLQKEMMELYRKEKANPLMGCLPMFLQIPVFLGLFHVLRRLEPGTRNDQRRSTAGPRAVRQRVAATGCSAPRSPAGSAPRAAELARWAPTAPR